MFLNRTDGPSYCRSPAAHLAAQDIDNDLAQEFTVSVKYLNSMISKVRDINVVLCVNSNAVRGVATRGCGADYENRIVAGRYPRVRRDCPSAMKECLP